MVDDPDDESEDEVVVVSDGDMECIPTQWKPLFKLISKAESVKDNPYESLYPGTTISKKYSDKLNELR